MHNIIIFMVYILGVFHISTRVGSIGGGTRITITGRGTSFYSMNVTFLITIVYLLVLLAKPPVSVKILHLNISYIVLHNWM